MAEDDTVRDQVEKALDRLGLDIELDEEILDYDSVDEIPANEIDSGRIKKNIYKKLPPESNERIDETVTVTLEDGTTIELNIQHRPECENCGNKVEEKHLRCGHANCDISLCSDCEVECRECGKKLCYNHQNRHTKEKSVLCPEHAES